MKNVSIIPKDLLEEFNKKNKDTKILDFKIRDGENFKTETIYYEAFNVLGVLKKTTSKINEYSWINDDSIIAGDLKIFLEKSRWFKGGKQ